MTGRREGQRIGAIRGNAKKSKGRNAWCYTGRVDADLTIAELSALSKISIRTIKRIEADCRPAGKMFGFSRLRWRTQRRLEEVISSAKSQREAGKRGSLVPAAPRVRSKRRQKVPKRIRAKKITRRRPQRKAAKK